MKKYIQITICLLMALLLCAIMASCGEKEVEPCETHTDADGNLVCDVCQATITPEGPSQAEIERTEKEAITTQLNNALSSWVNLINGEKTLGPSTTIGMEVKTNLPSSHWVSRLKQMSLNDRYVYMTLDNNNKYAKQETENIIIGVLPKGIYAIEDDTINLNYYTHLYTPYQMMVNADLVKLEHLIFNADSNTYSIDSTYLVTAFKKLLTTPTALEINEGLYDSAMISRITKTVLTESSITLDEYDEISALSIKYFSKDNGLTTDICTIVYENSAGKMNFNISFNLNYIVDLSYTRNATSTYAQYTYSFLYNTSKPDDYTFNKTSIEINGVLSQKEDKVVVQNDDLLKKMDAVKNSMVYVDTMRDKYSATYYCDHVDWTCENVYIYDARYDAYILLSHEGLSGNQLKFKTIDFDVDFTDACLGTLDLVTKRVTIQQHSNKELLHAQLKEQYNFTWTAMSTECLSIAIYDEDNNQYIFFKRTPQDETFVYMFSHVADKYDETTTCLAKVSSWSQHTISFVKHNTNHTSH